jgi:hypothetical protein
MRESQRRCSAYPSKPFATRGKLAWIPKTIPFFGLPTSELPTIVEDQDHAIEVQDAHAAILPPLDTIPGPSGEEELSRRRLFDTRTATDRLDPVEESHADADFGVNVA